MIQDILCWLLVLLCAAGAGVCWLGVLLVLVCAGCLVCVLCVLAGCVLGAGWVCATVNMYGNTYLLLLICAGWVCAT